ncbi:MAG TPA: chorismate mutase [Sedimentibacter sp.]|nr:chorismate mutase [Sedimentibacter sp.]HNZ82224.1 chorismate mutase [Sedimentibacter sp.]HOH68852.1 chorismate mutase [Sedimentibacter sp.]HPX00439.1 chorismate mutase [Sedimentibacter sp.]HQB63455.1 chorismate mutase [Sedimentibacter sp.]
MELDKARAEIDKLDKEIVKLLEKRFNLASEIGFLKKEQNLPVYDESRERQVLEYCAGILENKEYSKYICDIYFQIMNICKDIQRLKDKE